MFTFLLSILETLETALMFNSKVLRVAITRTPVSFFSFLGKLKAIIYVRAIGETVPAYKKFLKKNGVVLGTIKTLNDFQSLPITTKENYILEYPLNERVLNGMFPNAGNIDESAGSTGKATMWIRSFKEEKKLNRLITFALDYTFNSFKKKNIVVLNCWSNGPWATGIKFAFIAQHSTLVKAIGTNKVNVIETIKTLGKNCEYVLCGYPPFMKEVIDYGEEQGMNWGEYRLDIITGGEGFSEGWRDFMRERIKGSQGEVYSAYGASDIDIGVAFETDFTIAVRKKLANDSELRKKLFGDTRTPLFVGQYNPLIYYIEESASGELLFTLISQHTASPKIRYNLKDSGHILTFAQARTVLTKQEQVKYIGNNALQLPFIIVYGRSDGTISLDGANIFSSDVQHGLFSSSIAQIVHTFFLETAYAEDKSMYFAVHVELTEKADLAVISKEKLLEVEETIANHLVTVNRDYKESYENNKKSLAPRVILHKFGDDLFSQNKSKLKNVYINKSVNNKI